MKSTIEIPLQTRAATVSTLGDRDGARTARLVWSTGAAVKRFNWFTDKEWLEELSMDPAHVRLARLNDGAPLLNTHDRTGLAGVIGVTEKAWLENGEGKADVRFSRRAEVSSIWADVVDKIIRNVSVGYKVHRLEDVSTPEDVKARVLRMRATDWEPMEISLVPIGADAGAGLRSSDAEKNRCELLGGLGFDPRRWLINLAEAELVSLSVQ